MEVQENNIEIPNDEVLLYNKKDLQLIFHCGENKVDSLIKTDGFPVLRLNKNPLVPKKQLIKWIDENVGTTIHI